MAGDKRSYQRYRIGNRPILLFIDGGEYSGTITDVSENGMCVKVDGSFRVSQSINYQFCYKLGGGGLMSHINVVEGTGTIARVGEDFIGCRLLLNEKLSEYVRAVICGAV